MSLGVLQALGKPWGSFLGPLGLPGGWGPLLSFLKSSSPACKTASHPEFQDTAWIPRDFQNTLKGVAETSAVSTRPRTTQTPSRSPDPHGLLSSCYARGRE